MRKITICVLSLAMVLGIHSLATAASLKIGTMSPLTGNYAQDGTDILQGVKTAVAQVEAAGGIKGFDKIEVLAEDSACDGGKATMAANKLVNSGVAGVIGAYCSSETIPASVPINEAKIIMITPASSNEQITERGFKYMFRLCARDDAQAKVTVKFLEEGLKIKTLALIDDRQTYTVGLTKNITEGVNKSGKIKIVAHEHITPGDKDFTAVLTNLKQANPDLIYLSTYQPEGSLITRQAESLGLKSKLMSEDATYHPKYLEVAGKTAEGVYFTFPPTPATPERKNFEEQYKKAWKVDKIGSYAYYAFDSTNILLGAIKAAGSTESAKVEPAIRSTLWKGATGEIKFDAKGDRAGGHIVWIVKGGNFVPYWDPATGKNY